MLLSREERESLQCQYDGLEAQYEKLAARQAELAARQQAAPTPRQARLAGQEHELPGRLEYLEIARLYRKPAELRRQLGLKSKETSEVWQSIQF